MARQTVGVIMQNISATVNQDPTQPTDGSADFLLWLQFINRAQIEWAETYDWEVLRTKYYPSLGISPASMASIGLPADFRKLSGPVVNYSTGVAGGESWPQIKPEDQLLYSPNGDKFFTVNGDPSNGYYLLWSPGTLTSGATVEIPYYSMPTSLVSATQYPVMPDSEFLVNRTVAYVLEARSDPRYQDQERKARERLLQMVENQNLDKFNPYTGPIPVTTPERRNHFRFGRN